MKPTHCKGKSSHRRGIAAAIATSAAAVALLAAAPSALALGITGLVAEPTGGATPTQAGANRDFHIHVDFTSPADDVHDIRIGLPAGQIGDPTVTPKCTLAEFNGVTGCPANTEVGTVVTSIQALSMVPLDVSGVLYNLVANPGEPARFGIILSPAGALLPLGEIKLESAVELRQTDYGLDTIINPIPNTAAGLVPIDVTAMDVTLSGDSPAFARNPTSCTEATTTFVAHSYGDLITPITGEASYTPTGCENLEFSPAFSARLGAPGETADQSHPPMTTLIEQESTEAGLRVARVSLPPSLSTAPGALGNTCSQADFEAGTCPAASIVGSATATSPLLPTPLTGPVSLVESSGLPNVGLDLQGDLHLLLKGEFVPGESVGVSFDGLPDIPISTFALSFNGGPGSLVMANRNLCAPPPSVFTTDFTAHSGATQSGPTDAVIEGCAAPTPPRAKVKLKGAGSGRPTLKLNASAGSSKLRVIRLRLAKGLAFAKGATFKEGVKVKADGAPIVNPKIRHGARKLVLTVGAGAGAATLTVGKGALAVRTVGKKKLKFPLRLVDVDGLPTLLTAKARAKR